MAAKDAKNQFSKLVQKARHEGPQEITVRGELTAVVLSAVIMMHCAPGGRRLLTLYLTGRSGTMNSERQSKRAANPPAETRLSDVSR